MNLRVRTVVLAWAILVLSPVPPALGMSPRRSNETGMARVLFIGDRPTMLSPYRSMTQDPFLDMTPVKASRVSYQSDVISKSIRVYMPRSYKDLTEKEDIISGAANADVFEPYMVKWISDGVIEDGMGFVMTGGREAFGGYFGMPSWTFTAIGNILPIEAPYKDKGPTSRIKILKPENIHEEAAPLSPR